MEELLTKLFAAAGQGNWKLVTAFLVILVVTTIRKYGVQLWAPLGQGKWAVAVAVATGALLAVADGAVTGKVGSLPGALVLLLDGAVTGLVAAGVWKGWRELKAKPPVL